jgi:hypothetical protein
MTPTIEELARIKDVSLVEAAMILAVIGGDVDPVAKTYAGAFPDTVSWFRSCHNRPSRFEITEHAVGEILGVDFEALEVETAPTTRFFGTYVGNFVGSYANMGDPYVATLVHCYRDLGAGDPFEEDGWYVCGWADLLEAAEAHYKPEEDEPEEWEDEDGEV